MILLEVNKLCSASLESTEMANMKSGNIARPCKYASSRLARNETMAPSDTSQNGKKQRDENCRDVEPPAVNERKEMHNLDAEHLRDSACHATDNSADGLQVDCCCLA